MLLWLQEETKNKTKEWEYRKAKLAKYISTYSCVKKAN